MSSDASRDPEPQPQPPFSWIPAYAGMTPLRQKNSVTEPLVARPFCFADNRSRSGAVPRRVVRAMTELVAFKYRAFISYSHADTAWAKWLHRALERFPHRQGSRRAARRRPERSPKPAPDLPRSRRLHRRAWLSDQTFAALDASAALIVICSPAAAKSHYVNEEIRLFESRYPKFPVIPLIVAGKPGDAELECFPPALKFKLDAEGQSLDDPIELLAAGAREESDGKSLALAKVIAGMLGVSSDDIFRRAERERHHKGRVRNSVIAAARHPRRRCDRQRDLCLAATQD